MNSHRRVRRPRALPCAEAALFARARRVRPHVQFSSDGVFHLDRCLCVTRQSESTTRVLGYPPGWLRGRSFLDVVHPNDRVAFTRALRGQLAAPKIAAVELRARLRHYDGGWRPIQATGANLLDEPSVRSLVLSVRDVTASAQVETQRRRLAKIVDATSDLVATVEPDGYLIDLNPAGRALLGVDAEADITGLNLADFAADELEAGAIAAAMVAAAFDGTWRGEATLRARDGRVIPTLAVIVGQCDDTGDIEDFSAILRDITERKRLEDELAHQAFHDALTGLANRALLLDRLGHALDRGDRAVSSVAVLLIDLDDFKIVNDTLGHLTGDGLLAAIGRRLSSGVRAGDTVARLGGDEFAVVLESVGETEAVGLAERILTDLSRPFVLADQEVFSHASVGIALSDGDGVCGENLLRDADLALYQAKGAGKGRYAVFEPAMRAAHFARMELHRDLGRALEHDEFLLHYQPIVDLETCDVIGVEALVRWRHPQRGLVPPAAFIPAAEETGLIIPLGAWALHEACRQLAAWRAEDPGAADLTVHVNVSARQLVAPGFVDGVLTAVDVAGLSSTDLVIEITESVLIEAAAEVAARLGELRLVGVRVAIDDFGTGYSSLSALEQLPIDVLKVDKSFVDGVGERQPESAIVIAITRMAQALGLDLVAEGIEREEQHAGLRRLGCRFGQGYMFARPLDAADVLLALAAQKRAGDRGLAGGAGRRWA